MSACLKPVEVNHASHKKTMTAVWEQLMQVELIWEQQCEATASGHKTKTSKPERWRFWFLLILLSIHVFALRWCFHMLRSEPRFDYLMHWVNLIPCNLITWYLHMLQTSPLSLSAMMDPVNSGSASGFSLWIMHTNDHSPLVQRSSQVLVVHTAMKSWFCLIQIFSLIQI